MKNKKIILSLAFPLLISCGQNNHDFSIKWENDENYHWHVCQIEGHNDTSKKEKHMWDNGKVIKEPSKTETGTMKYVCTTCLKEKTETIDKLKEQTTYTITFDSRGGSVVKSITAEAGAKIVAPNNPTKENYIFVGWFESSDGGKTLNDKQFEFSYMPARVFTLYAKWGIENIKGKTYNHTSSIITWNGTDEEKNEFLNEMGITEEEYQKMNDSTTIKFTFDNLQEKATAIFGVEFKGEVEMNSCTVFYKINGNSIVFFDSEEDMKAGIPAHTYGLFNGTTTTFSSDRTKLILTGITGIMKLEHILSIVDK